MPPMLAFRLNILLLDIQYGNSMFCHGMHWSTIVF
jgi:hypothetical protein